jgi:hypothetical protein
LEVQSSLGPSLNNYDNLIQRNNNSIFLTPSVPSEVSKVINNLPNKNGLNDIPVRIFKRVRDDISIIISSLFNLMIEGGIYPDNVKLARVVPVHKSGNKKLTKNYRPISVLPTLNKIFEKLLYTRLNVFLQSSGMLSQDQFGFTNLRDMQQAALKLIDMIMPAFGTKQICVCVFLDFSKAFDTVYISLLAPGKV